MTCNEEKKKCQAVERCEKKGWPHPDDCKKKDTHVSTERSTIVVLPYPDTRERK